MYNQNSIVSQEEIPSNTLIHNRYLIRHILGRGGLGRTYLASDTHRFSEPCVLKEFAPFDSGHYDFAKSRNLFKREAKILHQLTHPQIPKFLACFEDRGRLFLVQEFVNGKAYSQILEERQRQQKAFTEPEIIKWLVNILPILDYIHQLGIIHRDISPDNIMQPQGKSLPVLIDFGVGKLTNLALESAQNSFRKPSYVGKMSFVGKIGYAPKEQISMGRCSPSSDVYALGVTALVLLTGKDPTALLNHLSLEWEWHKYTRISPQLQKILSRMTEEKPLQRYQSAREVLKDLYQSFFRQKASNKSSAVARSRSAKPKQPAKTVSNTSQTTSQQPVVSPQRDETIIAPSAASSSPTPAPIVDDTFIVTGVNSAPQEIKQPTNYNSADNYASNNQIPPDDSTMIVSYANAGASNPELKRQHNPYSSGIQPEFIGRCQQELSYYIGSMASIVVQEVMQQQQPRFDRELIDALVEYIPDRDRVREFKQRLRS